MKQLVQLLEQQEHVPIKLRDVKFAGSKTCQHRLGCVYFKIWSRMYFQEWLKRWHFKCLSIYHPFRHLHACHSISAFCTGSSPPPYALYFSTLFLLGSKEVLNIWQTSEICTGLSFPIVVFVYCFLLKCKVSLITVSLFFICLNVMYVYRFSKFV